MNADKIILYDGICQLCNLSVKFVKKHDPAGQFVFYSLQSKTGLDLINKYFNGDTSLQSIILIDKDMAYAKSTAALKICAYLSAPVKWLTVFRFVPPVIRNLVYDLIARYRYKIFGYHTSCSISDKI